MVTETEENQEVQSKGFDENAMFDSESFINQQDEDESFDIAEYDGVVKKDPEPVKTAEEIAAESKALDDDDPDKIDFEGKTEEQKIDLEAFNKKFDKKFQTEEELKAFMDGKTNEVAEQDDDLVYEQAETHIAALEPVLAKDTQGRWKVNDEELIRRQLQTKAVRDEGLDVNDEQVQIDIEEKIQQIIDSGNLSHQAEYLRDKLVALLDSTKTVKEGIDKKREDAKEAIDKAYKEDLQKEFININNAGNFFGIELDKKSIAEAYNNVASGKFIENLKTDKHAVAELSLMATFKEKIFKKASGLTYNDGIKSVLDEFSVKQKESPVVKAQQRGSIASAGVQDALINGLLYEKPEEDKK